jgi:hypothetical protein
MYLDVERRVDDIPHLLDYETTPDENVAYLADWLGIDNPGGVYTTDQLRRLIGITISIRARREPAPRSKRSSR